MSVRSSGEAEFYTLPDRFPTISTLDGSLIGRADRIKSRVSVRRLDDILGDAPVDLVKIDVEGAEPLVLRGMRRALERHHPAIFCEVLAYGGTADALHELLDPLGYVYYHLTPAGPVRTTRIAGHLEWRNFLMAPESSLVSAEAFAAH